MSGSEVEDGAPVAPRGESSTPMQPKTYGCKVGSIWVAIDFEAQAIAITRTDEMNRPVKTEDLGNGFIVDRNAEGRVCAVEVLG